MQSPAVGLVMQTRMFLHHFGDSLMILLIESLCQQVYWPLLPNLLRPESKDEKVVGELNFSTPFNSPASGGHRCTNQQTNKLPLLLPKHASIPQCRKELKNCSRKITTCRAEPPFAFGFAESFIQHFQQNSANMFFN